MPVPPNKRPDYDSIPPDDDDINRLWDQTEAASDGFDPLPNGTYRCLVSDGRKWEAKKGTKSYKLTFTVIDGEFVNRKLWHDLWLTPKALAMTKRDLSKLRIHRPEQLHQAPPAGIVCDVKVVVETREDGARFNVVRGFKVVEDAPPPRLLDPEDEDTDDGGVIEGGNQDTAEGDDIPF